MEAALHQLELHQREITGDSYPYGLQLMLASLPSAIHRGDPIKLLDIDPALAGGVVLTTITDVVGYMAFLGLGAAFLL